MIKMRYDYFMMFQIYLGTLISSIPLWIWIYFNKKDEGGSIGLLGLSLVNFKDLFKK